MHSKIGNRIMLIIFIAFCFIWVMWFFVEPYVVTDNNENREKSARPSLAMSNYAEYPSQYEEYLNDTLPFREWFISLNNKIDFYIFKKSTSDSVILGKEDWLFLKDTLADYQRNNLYSEQELAQIAADVQTTQKYFEDQGIEFIIFIGPNKSSIYGENMPEKYEVNSGVSRTEQVVDYLTRTTDVRIIYPEMELRQVKEEYPDLQLYFKLDTHWNYMGGYWGTKPLLRELGVELEDFAEIQYREINEPDFIWNGYDLANMLGLADVLNQDINYELEGYSSADVTYYGNPRDNIDYFNGMFRVSSNAENQRKVFLVRDSFGQAMIPYLGASFKEVVSVYRKGFEFSRTLIENENPDVFVYEMVERSSWDLINYLSWPE